MQKLNHVWKNRLVTTFSFLILIMPLLGFPHSWSDKFYFILGFAIVVLSFQLGSFLVYGEEKEHHPEIPVEKIKRERKHKTSPITETPVTSDWHEEEKSV